MLTMAFTPVFSWGQTSDDNKISLGSITFVNPNNNVTNSDVNKGLYPLYAVWYEEVGCYGVSPEIKVKDTTGQLVASSEYDVEYKNNKEAGIATVTAKAKPEGNYRGSVSGYFQIMAYYDSGDEDNAYPIKKCTTTYKTKAYEYTGKAIKPNIPLLCDTRYNKSLFRGVDYDIAYGFNKNVGYGKIVLFGKRPIADELCVYYGSKTIKFKIIPQGTEITSKSSDKKSFTVKWKKQKVQTTGYQIRYSTKSSMSKAKKVTVKKNSTMKKTIKNLNAKKKYYIQVRTYKTVDGTKFYSKWSAKKTVRTK